MIELKEATEKLIEAIKDGTPEAVSNNLQACLQQLSSANSVQIDEFMLAIFELSALDDLDKATYALTMCGFLVELGYSSRAILDPLINLFDQLLEKSYPFFVLLTDQLPSLKEGEDASALLDALLNNKVLVSDETRIAVETIDRFYPAAVSAFSIDTRNHARAKEKLSKKIRAISNFSEGGYWLNKLFNTLFDEPIIVIDIDKRIGFEGRMSGVGDNYHLQQLLMSLPDINETVEITEEQLATLKGTGVQTLDASLVNKWNMYAYSLVQQEDWEKLVNSDDIAAAMSFKNDWIWSEGEPADIPVHNGSRVILLGKASYARSSAVQRNFKNMKAKIQVDNTLTEAEIASWLKS